jgi:hypothetical protein
MATLRLLLALVLMALGTTGAAFAISGYFDPRLWPGAKATADAAVGGKPKLELAPSKPRQRFLAIEAKGKPATAAGAVAAIPPRAKATTAKAAIKRPPVKEVKEAKETKDAKDGSVQQAAAWWPLANLFKN